VAARYAASTSPPFLFLGVTPPDPRCSGGCTPRPPLQPPAGFWKVFPVAGASSARSALRSLDNMSVKRVVSGVNAGGASMATSHLVDTCPSMVICAEEQRPVGSSESEEPVHSVTPGSRSRQSTRIARRGVCRRGRRFWIYTYIYVYIYVQPVSPRQGHAGMSSCSPSGGRASLQGIEMYRSFCHVQKHLPILLLPHTHDADGGLHVHTYTCVRACMLITAGRAKPLPLSPRPNPPVFESPLVRHASAVGALSPPAWRSVPAFCFARKKQKKKKRDRHAS
jgi:hypothetical protein